MIYIYTLFNILTVAISVQYFKRFFNPMTLYAIVWQLALGIHESGYIVYNKLSGYTWLFIILSQICLFLGLISPAKRNYNKRFIFNDLKYKRNVEKVLLICAIFSAISILSSLALVISLYGTNLIANVTNVYADRVNENTDYQVIPYIGALLYVGLPLTAIHMKKYGFSKWIIIYFILIFSNSLISGARAGIVFSIFIFVSAFIFAKNIKFIYNNPLRKKSSKGPIIASVILLVTMFVVISSKRAAGVELQYATNLFKEHFGYNELIYKTFAYIANPVGVLNEFLKNPDFNFGQNTLMPIYNILAKLGFMKRVEQYQSWYYVPAPCNVGTWLRELLEEFSLLSLILIFVFGYVTTKIYWRAIRGETGYILLISIFLTIIGLSFFDWRLRTSSMWIALFVGYLIGKRIDNKSYDYNLNP